MLVELTESSDRSNHSRVTANVVVTKKKKTLTDEEAYARAMRKRERRLKEEEEFMDIVRRHNLTHAIEESRRGNQQEKQTFGAAIQQ